MSRGPAVPVSSGVNCEVSPRYEHVAAGDSWELKRAQWCGPWSPGVDKACRVDPASLELTALGHPLVRAPGLSRTVTEMLTCSTGDISRVRAPRPVLEPRVFVNSSRLIFIGISFSGRHMCPHFRDACRGGAPGRRRRSRLSARPGPRKGVCLSRLHGKPDFWKRGRAELAGSLVGNKHLTTCGRTFQTAPSSDAVCGLYTNLPSVSRPQGRSRVFSYI